MWTSNIVNTSYNNGILLVNVQFTNGENSIIKTIDLTGGSMDVLNQKIQSQIDTLNASDDLLTQIPIGAFTPVLPTPDPEQVAIAELSQAKQLVDLGIITEDDSQYTDALTTAQNVVAQSSSKIESAQIK